jgi:hypothetical protein
MAVNSRLRENPGLQKYPRDEREWTNYQNELAKWVIKIAKLGDGTMVTSGDTTIDGLGEMPGIVPSEQSLQMVSTGNLRSIQDVVSPLTHSDGGASATITIASHGLDMSSGLVSYNSGSITGLAYSTKYYVYAIDAAYAGGAVTYLSTTANTDLVTNAGTYYVDNITTGAQATSGNISAITKASPTTFTTSAAHGFVTGYSVDIASIVDDGGGGSDLEAEFNGNSYTVTVTDTTNFTVAVDTSSHVAVWVSGGTATYTPPSGPGQGEGGGGK